MKKKRKKSKKRFDFCEKSTTLGIMIETTTTKKDITSLEYLEEAQRVMWIAFNVSKLPTPTPTFTHQY